MFKTTKTRELQRQQISYYQQMMLPIKTSRDRPKSAPYLRLKNRKKTSECQSIGFFEKKSLRMPKKLKGRTLWYFSTSILSQNSKQIERRPSGEKKFEKKSHNAEKAQRVDPLVSPGNVCYAEKKKNIFCSVS